MFIFQISIEEKESQAKIVEREVKAAVSKVTAAYEERLSSVRAEHTLKIQQGTIILNAQDVKNLMILKFFSSVAGQNDGGEQCSEHLRNGAKTSVGYL